jgi:phenylalanyl-tRNA synthetase beta subunit
MGGDSTAVTLDTTNIYLEAAFWWPDSIRGRSRKLQLLDRCRRIALNVASTIRRPSSISNASRN